MSRSFSSLKEIAYTEGHPLQLHTFETRVGMVRLQGHPIQNWPFDILHDTELKPLNSDQLVVPKGLMEVLKLLVQCVENKELPWADKCPSKTALQIKANVYALTRRVRASDLKKFFMRQSRTTLEHAAGMIVAFLGPQYAERLIPHLQAMIYYRASFASPPNAGIPGNPIGSVGWAMDKVRDHMASVKSFYNIPGTLTDEILNNDEMLVDYLSRLRRRGKTNICLSIPDWMSRRVGRKPRIGEENLDQGWVNIPEDEDKTNLIEVSRKGFRTISRWLSRAMGGCRPEDILRRKIRTMVDESLGSVSVDAMGELSVAHIKPVLETEDPFALAYSFFALQRKLQPTVVSDINSARFLSKGETCQQNTWRIPTGFQTELFKLAKEVAAKEGRGVDWAALSCIHRHPDTPKDISNKDVRGGAMRTVIDKIQDCCLLMEEFVHLHGNNDFDNLTFKRGVHGGARGPVDQYNALVDVFNQLAKEYTLLRENPPVKLPSACHKFLAKDIMQWNNSWGDDAFANGRRPGWWPWLKERRVQGLCPAVDFELLSLESELCVNRENLL